ncbi:haloacid dehalogenase-like hydrolase [Streptomyces sp. NBC_01471]|uniref:HAD family hydrolase n=1 Tax=Streptomyces sp. NBC_01471 TaxID=2903879 RepID=UPI00324A3272
MNLRNPKNTINGGKNRKSVGPSKSWETGKSWETRKTGRPVNSGNIAALDVDGTLYDGTLGFSVLDELRESGWISEAAVSRVRAAMAEHRGAGTEFRTTLHRTCSAYGSAVSGVPYEEVVRASHGAWRRVRHRLLECAAPLVETLRAAGYTPLLLSGSPQEMVDRIGDELGVEHRTGLAPTVRGGVCTPHLRTVPAVPEVKAALLRAAAARLGADPARSLAIGNSASDRELLRGVGMPIAFEPDPALSCLAGRHGWPVADRNTVVGLARAVTSMPASRWPVDTAAATAP